MNKIDITKQYKTLSGLPARIYAVDGGGNYPVHGAIYNLETNTWRQETWSNDLKYRIEEDENNSNYDLVEVGKYDDFKIDDNVIVWCNGRVNEKIKGHFAGLTDDGKPKVWGMGRTSFTSDGYFEVADYCELAEKHM